VARVTDVVGQLPPADRRSAFANAPMGVALATPEGVLVDANPALAAMLGRTPEELLGQSVLELAHPEASALARAAHARLLAAEDGPMRLETTLVRSDGTDVPVQVTASWVPESPDGLPAHLVVIVEDITERKALEAQLVHRSLHDPLTGLPNRLLFRDRLRHALTRGQRECTPTALLIIDLDGFKAVNDRLGHPMGDLLLVQAAERLRSVLRASDTAARLGGDEFAIVCETTGSAEAEVLAHRVRATGEEPFVLRGEQATVGVSIGIGCVPGGEDAAGAFDRVIREADHAMYADKAARRS
jgi:diguanylate cyclase (GGDEF)-like protein/PAS domain S-box-containing protein